MTHTDLKPENILLASMASPRPAFYPRADTWNPSTSDARNAGPYMRPVSNAIRMIDFGNATYDHEHHSSIINTRQYRSPEVILEMGWDSKSDIWSMGCIFAELYTGELLFGTHENLEHLALMEKTLEPMQPRLLNRTSKEIKEKYLMHSRKRDGYRLAWPEKNQSSSSERHVSQQRTLEEIVPYKHYHFQKFLRDILTLHPAHRPSASEALHFPFLTADVRE